MALFRRAKPPFSLKTLQKDPNCVGLYVPQIWGGADQLVRQNLLSYTEDFSNAAWTLTNLQAFGSGSIANATNAPNGTATAAKIVCTAGAGVIPRISLTTQINAISGVTYKFSIYVKQAELTWARILSTGAAGTVIAYCNLATGAIGGSGNPTALSVEAAANGFYRCTLSLMATSSANMNVFCQMTTADGAGTMTGDGTSGIYVWGAQLTRADTPDQSYQKVTDWTTEVFQYNAQRQLPWLRRNRFVSTATLATQTVSSVTASQLTVSFTGTGTITFSGAYSGSLVGTGASNRVQTTFTPAAGNLTCTVTGSVTLAQCENAAAATAYQDVGASWPATYTALAQAAGYPITLYSDRAGTIAVDSPETVVGVELDLSKQLSFSADLVTNGSFNNGVTGWAPNGSATIANVSAELEITITGSAGGALGTLTTNVVAGKTYAMYIDIRAGTYASELTIKIPSSSTVVNVTPTSIKTNYRAVFMAAATSNTFLIARNAVATGTVYIDNVMLFEIAGNHLVAPSDAARPLLKRDGNGKYYLLRDLVDDSLNVTLPNYGANCVHYRSTDKIVLKDQAITLNGATSFSVESVDYGRILLSGPSNNDAKIQKYLDSIAGRSSPAVLGPELVTNGGFDSDTVWVKGTGWTIANGVATSNHAAQTGNQDIYQTGFNTSGSINYVDCITGLNNFILYSIDGQKFYLCSLNITLSAGICRVFITLTTGRLIIRSQAATFDGTVDNVSVREIL